MTLSVILSYIALLLFLTLFSTRLLRKTSGDFFLASRGIGSFMLLMSIFGTTMTAFALLGSTGKTFVKGVGVYGLMASSSAILHPACFFLIGARVCALGKRYGYITQISFFRDRYRSETLALVLFVVMVAFVMIYILMGIVGAGRVVHNLTPETLPMSHQTTTVVLEGPPPELVIPAAWEDRLSYDRAAGTLLLKGSIATKRRRELVDMAGTPTTAWRNAVDRLIDESPRGAIPYWLATSFICLVVLIYVFFGGMRATAWANTFQTMVFMAMGLFAFVVIMHQLGGPVAASERLLASAGADRAARQGLLGQLEFLTYCFIPLSVGMFPHLFQHWLTAKRVSAFKLTVVAHPICILITWLPCVMLGMWAASVLPPETDPNAVLAIMVYNFSGDVLADTVAGLIGAGILAAIMSSMDSQFLCLGSLFTNDVVAHYFKKGHLSDRQRVVYGRAFVATVVVTTFVIALFEPGQIFDMGVWCFTGFASLFPLVVAAVYWKRSNKYGAISAVVLVAIVWLACLPMALEGKEEFLIFGMLPVTFLFTMSAGALILGTLITPPPDPELVKRFFPSELGS